MSGNKRLAEFAVTDGQAMKLLQVARRNGRYLALVELDDGEGDGSIVGELYAYPGEPDFDGPMVFAVFPDIWADTAKPDTLGDTCDGMVNSLEACIAYRFTSAHLADRIRGNLSDDRSELLLARGRVGDLIQRLQALVRDIDGRIADGEDQY